MPFKRKLRGRITRQQIDAVIGSIKELGTFVQLRDIPAVCRDPDDDAYLACVIVSDCDYLVSGDPDLLDLRKHGRTKIVSPADFLSVLKQQS
jgi:putative PIN family toxin of toxin-antitoxin system